MRNSSRRCRRHIANHNPQIVHFAGHASADGRLLFPRHWSTGEDFEKACCQSHVLHTVFVNACFGDKVIGRLVEPRSGQEAGGQEGCLVVCWPTLVETTTAAEFSTHFYHAYAYELGSGRTHSCVDFRQSRGGGAQAAAAQRRRLRVFFAFQFARSRLAEWLRARGSTCGDPRRDPLARGVVRLLAPDPAALLAAAMAEEDHSDCGTPLSAPNGVFSDVPPPLPWAVESNSVASGNGGSAGAAGAEDSSGSCSASSNSTCSDSSSSACLLSSCLCRFWCCHEHFRLASCDDNGSVESQ